MELLEKPKRFSHHNNAFGALRLLFASLVVLAHTPELIDGNRSREMLTRIFGTMSFGELAVNSFFIVSGYLITASYLSSSSASSYLQKRVARIYPAFVLAFLICTFVIAPLVGAWPLADKSTVTRIILDCLFLQPPVVSGSFAGSPYPMLNGSLWTIAYEFRCYLLVALLGVSGILGRRGWLLGITVAFLILTLLVPVPTPGPWVPSPAMPNSSLYSLNDLRITLLGSPRQQFRLIAAFLTGATFYTFRHSIIFSKFRFCACSAGFIISLCFERTSEIGTIIFGSYMIFTVAERGGATLLGKINNKNDVSYGLYLYAWPVTKVINWYEPDMALITVIILTWLISWTLGWASWLLLEKPVMTWIRSRRTRGPAITAV